MLLLLFQQSNLSTVVGGTGGNGIASDITGTVVVYGSGAGGGGGLGGVPGSGAGAGASEFSATGGSGSPNLGGGGGGGTYKNTVIPAGSGGSGIVVITYPGSPRGQGGTISSNSTHTIHVFTTSGQFIP